MPESHIKKGDEMRKGIGFILIVMITLAVAVTAAFAAKPHDNTLKIYGAGRPHTAIIRAGEVFTEQTGIKVDVTFGPESRWTEDAKKDADILWRTAEQAMTAFLENFKDFNRTYLHT